jgi:hypothetical protein
MKLGSELHSFLVLWSKTLSSSYYITVNVTLVHRLPEYKPQLDVSLPPEHNPKFLALYENLPQSDFRDFPHHPMETNTTTILNCPTSRKPVDFNQVSVEARQLAHLNLSSDQEIFNSGICERRD